MSPLETFKYVGIALGAIIVIFTLFKINDYLVFSDHAHPHNHGPHTHKAHEHESGDFVHPWPEHSHDFTWPKHSHNLKGVVE